MYNMPGIVLSMSDTVSHLIFTDTLLRKDSMFSSLQIRQPRVKELECFSQGNTESKRESWLRPDLEVGGVTWGLGPALILGEQFCIVGAAQAWGVR